MLTSFWLQTAHDTMEIQTNTKQQPEYYRITVDDIMYTLIYFISYYLEIFFFKIFSVFISNYEMPWFLSAFNSLNSMN